MTRFVRSIALAAGAALTFAVPAVAREDAPWSTVKPEEQGGAFKAICLDHPGDPAAQSSAGLAAPWSLMQQGPIDANGRTGYRTGNMQLGVVVKDGTNVCAITTGYPIDANIANVAAKVGTMLKLGDPKIGDDGRARWTAQTPYGPKEVRLTMKPSTEIGLSIATLIIIIDNIKAV